MPTTWEEAAEETAATLKRDVIQKWTEADVDPLDATRQVLARLGDEPGQYPPVQGFRHIAENGIVGYLKVLSYETVTEAGVNGCIHNVVQTIIKKQHDYGHGNIEAYGRLGLLVRLSDKCARIENLVKRQGKSEIVGLALNESLEDSWLDIAGYGIIGCMFELGTFMLPLAADLGDGMAFTDMGDMVTDEPTWEDDVRDLVVDVLIQHGLIPNVTRLDRTIP